MKVSELKPRAAFDVVDLEVVSLEEPREWSNARGNGTLCKANCKDDSGTVSVTLWNDDIGKVKKGDKVRIENGWVSEFQGELQVSAGRFGKLTVNP